LPREWIVYMLREVTSRPSPSMFSTSEEKETSVARKKKRLHQCTMYMYSATPAPRLWKLLSGVESG